MKPTIRYTPSPSDRRRLAAITKDPGGCWLMSLAPRPDGYVFIRNGDGRKMAAHRWLYEQIVGPVPDGLTLDHLCRNRACVNPEHLEAVEHAENVRRGVAPSAVNRRKKLCVRGHDLDDPANRRRRRGARASHRECRECYLAWRRERRAMERAR